MKRHKLTLSLCITALVLATAIDGFAADPVAPQVSASHREFLSRVARRTVEDALTGRGVHDPQYVPAALASLSAECLVRVRQGGYLLSIGAGGLGPIAIALRDAAASAARNVPRDAGTASGESDAWLIEIEVVGEATALPVDSDWSQAAVIEEFLEPGVDGVLILTNERARRVCPSEFIAADLPVNDAITRLAQSMQLGPDRIQRTPLSRFRTAHWYESGKGSPIVSLTRGLTVVPADAVADSGMNDAIGRLADYMHYRQRSSGLFAYQFEPGADRYSDEENVVHQVGAALALATHARAAAHSSSLAAADKAIQYHLQGLTPLPGHSEAAFIATSDGRNKLGVTALLSIALAQHPQPEKYEEMRRKLVKGMLALQAPTGMFVTAFPPATQLAGQEQFPGEALLALAADYDHQPSAEVLAAFDKAIEFYRDYFNSGRSATFVPWQVQAFALMAKHTKRKDYQDFVFELSDWLADKQLTEANCPWAELVGGVGVNAEGRVGAATAAYLEAFADALALARSVGDKQRSARYERVVRDAARFVMQLQVRPEEAYYARSPLDMVGGIRSAPAWNRLRIDHCHHALVGLLKARGVLFPIDG